MVNGKAIIKSNNVRGPWLAALLLVPIAGTACSSAVRPQGPAAPVPAPAAPAPSTEPVRSTPPGAAGAQSDAEFERIFKARMDSARMRFTKADVDFITMMIPHHAQAVEMSVLVPKNSTNGTIHTLAGRIINAQKDEIRIMQEWLRDRGQPVPEVHIMDASMDHPPGHQMPAAGGHAGHAMPGMLTPAQIAELKAARGTAFDRLYLTRMIAHHQGAVKMVQDLFATDGALNDEAVFKIASDVQVDQLTEIARMELMLRAMPASQP